MDTRIRLTFTAAAAVVAMAGLAGCGSDGGPSAGPSVALDTNPTVAAGASVSATPSASASSPSASAPASSTPSGPACSAVWKQGKKLPGKYAGCTDDATWVVADKRSCAFGGTLVTYLDRYYAVTGGPIADVGAGSKLESNKKYTSDLASCTG